MTCTRRSPSRGKTWSSGRSSTRSRSGCRSATSPARRSPTWRPRSSHTRRRSSTATPCSRSPRCSTSRSRSRSPTAASSGSTPGCYKQDGTLVAEFKRAVLVPRKNPGPELALTDLYDPDRRRRAAEAAVGHPGAHLAERAGEQHGPVAGGAHPPADRRADPIPVCPRASRAPRRRLDSSWTGGRDAASTSGAIRSSAKRCDEPSERPGRAQRAQAVLRADLVDLLDHGVSRAAARCGRAEPRRGRRRAQLSTVTRAAEKALRASRTGRTFLSCLPTGLADGLARERDRASRTEMRNSPRLTWFPRSSRGRPRDDSAVHLPPRVSSRSARREVVRPLCGEAQGRAYRAA